MRPDVLVVRHATSGAPQFLARHVKCAVVNAGDGAHEHPSQGLLDCFTLAEHFTRARAGRPRDDSYEPPDLATLAGKTIAIVGDIAHSRVARSDLHAFGK